MAPKPARTLNPCLGIGDETLVMATQFMAAVPASILHMPVTNLQSQRDGIVAAIDFLYCRDSEVQGGQRTIWQILMLPHSLGWEVVSLVLV